MIADRSIKNATPEQWARAVVAAYEEFDTDLVVAESSQGGDLIENVFRQNAPNLSYKRLWSKTGKANRAEPISSLYKRNLVSHVGEMKELESQLCSLVVGFNSKSAGYSPDHADAAVFAITELAFKRPVTTFTQVSVSGGYG